METKTVNCPECQSSNFYSETDELIRCRSCGANIHIDKNIAPQPEPVIRVPDTPDSSAGAPISGMANMGERLGTYLIDQFVTAMVFVILVAAGGNQLSDLNLTLLVLAIPAYYILLEGSNGKTIGKLVIGTRVVNEDGSPIGYGTAFFRTLCRMIPLEVFSIFFHNGRCWHDLITRTYVIKDR